MISALRAGARQWVVRQTRRLCSTRAMRRSNMNRDDPLGKPFLFFVQALTGEAQARRVPRRCCRATVTSSSKTRQDLPMEAIDLARVLDNNGLERAFGPGGMPVEDAYGGCGGMHVRASRGQRGLIQDVARLSDGAFMLASDYRPGQKLAHRQVVRTSDWVHIQLRLSCGGRETVDDAAVLETPVRTCVVSRYPQSAMIDREADVEDDWRSVCLLLSPTALTGLMDVSPSNLPDSVGWVTDPGSLAFKSMVLPLLPAMKLAAHDILACEFRGGNRRAYMRAKSLELLSVVIHALDEAVDEGPQTKVRLTPGDYQRIELARTLMMTDLETPLTIAQLARKVGLNRTKLSIGFRQVTGETVQAFWRDARLIRARELLTERGARVTDVSLSLGYTELSSFTRAFSRKFGFLPSDCRH
jgi:AraC-like DNA-binding protein